MGLCDTCRAGLMADVPLCEKCRNDLSNPGLEESYIPTDVLVRHGYLDAKVLEQNREIK